MRYVRILALILCAFLVPATWGQQAAGNVVTNWSEFHFPNMMRFNPAENILNVHNVGSLRVKWSYTTGDIVTSSAAAVNGVVYVGSGNGDVYALNANTGASFGVTAAALTCNPRPQWSTE